MGASNVMSSQNSKQTRDRLTLSGATLLGALALLGVGCGPRLSAPPESPTDQLANTPVAKMTVNLGAAKLDEHHKFAASGQFTVAGLFYKGADAEEVPVKVTVQPAADGTLARSYDLDLTAVAGTTAKVLMSDGGYLSVLVPPTAGAPAQFQTSNPNVTATSVAVPGGQPRTCYTGKDILEGQIRFALCDLQAQPVMVFLDAEPEPAAGAAAPAGAAAAAPEAPATQ
jgi:hypothetical protein